LVSIAPESRRQHISFSISNAAGKRREGGSRRLLQRVRAATASS
jgi:hypothetical protein